MSVRQEGNALIVESAHDGYQRLSGRPVHRRRWVLRAGHLEVRDFVEGGFLTALSRVYFHPDVKLQQKVGAGGTAQWQGHVLNWQAEAATVAVKPSSWAPEFGAQLDNVCLELTASEGMVVFTLSW